MTINSPKITNLKSTVKFNGVQYFGNVLDPMWQLEVDKLIPWIYGKGADIGCGQRSINKDIIRVDIDENNHPDILASGDNLPFKDGELDFITAVHSFEHFEDQYKTLKEWFRVLKKCGIIALVHPDVDYTKKQRPLELNPELKLDPFNKHWHENNLESFKIQLDKWKDLGFEIIDQGTACTNWSFYLIIQKK